MYPSELAFAPRPINGELLSSWARRLAAANQVKLSDIERCIGARLSDPKLAQIFDYGAPAEWRFAVAALTRVPERWVWVLDLRQHFPGATAAHFLHSALWPDTIQFGYCPECFSEQVRNRQRLHIKAEWALATVTRCFKHEQPLCYWCLHCGVHDPVRFTRASVECRDCSQPLSEWNVRKGIPRPEPFLTSFERAMTEALAGRTPPEPWGYGMTPGRFLVFLRDVFWLFTTTELIDPSLQFLLIDRIPLGRFGPRTSSERCSYEVDMPFFPARILNGKL